MPFLAALGSLLTRALSFVLTTFAGKLMTALGLSFVTYKGSEALQRQFIALMLDNLNGLPVEALQLLYMAGFGVGLNWVCGAVAFSLGLTSVTKLGSFLTE